MQSNSLGNPPQPRPALPASGSGSPVDAGFTEHSGHLRRNSTGIPTLDLSGVEGSGANVFTLSEPAEGARDRAVAPSGGAGRPMLIANRGLTELTNVSTH